MNEGLEEQIGILLQRHNLMVVTAESCTGGLIGNYLTNVPGASEYYLGGIIAYSNQAKKRLLNVKEETLNQYGAVSKETVEEMALGARKAFAADFNIDKIIGVSVSGIAGPGGGSEDKPVGTVWFGLSSADGEQAWKYQWSGNRIENKIQSAKALLIILLKYLKDYEIQQS